MLLSCWIRPPTYCSLSWLRDRPLSGESSWAGPQCPLPAEILKPTVRPWRGSRTPHTELGACPTAASDLERRPVGVSAVGRERASRHCCSVLGARSVGVSVSVRRDVSWAAAEFAAAGHHVAGRRSGRHGFARCADATPTVQRSVDRRVCDGASLVSDHRRRPVHFVADHPGQDGALGLAGHTHAAGDHGAGPAVLARTARRARGGVYPLPDRQGQCIQPLLWLSPANAGRQWHTEPPRGIQAWQPPQVCLWRRMGPTSTRQLW